MRKFKVLLIALILVLGGAIFCNSYAAERSLGAKLERPFNNLRYQYRVPGLTASGENTDILYTMVKIYDNADKDEADNLLYSKALYCLRGGVGFGSNEESDVSENVTYNELGEMHKDAKTIIEKYKEYYKNSKGEPVNLDRVETISDKQVNIYNAILWILDESYLRTSNADLTKYNEAEYKSELLSKAGVRANEQAEITKDDIEVIQQLAVWYFTNYDEQIEGVKPTVSQARMDVAAMLQINGDNNVLTGERLSNLNKLYQYFINGAINNASSYIVDIETGERTKNIEENKFDKNVKTEIKQIKFSNEKPTIPADEYYLIGPFKIDNGEKRVGEISVDVTNLVLYDANKTEIGHYYEFAEGKFVQVVEFINEADISKADAAAVTTLQKGLNYYIRINKFYVKNSGLDSIMPNEERYDLSNITLEITSSYTLSEATFLESGSNSQPVVEINKEKIYSGDRITTELPKEFDLSLRKFITSIKRGENNIEVESRVPQINTTTLINGITNRDGTTEYTATYTHSKNPLLVEIGDKVIYTIRIYNEGEVDGTATSVTDYLPEGLKFIPTSESEINTIYGWTNPSSDGKTIVTEYLKDKTIKAFDANKAEEEQGWQKATTGNGGLYYEDLQIECEVIASASGEAQNLRNIAAITEDTGDDRDSVPGDPGRDDYNPPAENSTYKEDDDDYEDLVLPGKKFDLALRKYIVAVNETNLSDGASRIPNVDVTPLNQLETTADYKHKKDPVQVENGDIVTYRFTVYNEGQLDGRVSSIIDYLPQGLEFDAEANTNFIEYKENVTYTTEELQGKEYAYKIEGNKITIYPISSVTNTESGIVWLFDLNSYNGTTLDSKSIDVKLKVNAEVSSSDKVLTNVATMTYSCKGAEVADIDSAGDNFTVPTAEKLVENLPGYKGNENNKADLTDSNYHYEGQQDDDDFEKVIIKGKAFDLALRKYISSVKRDGENVEFDSREPQIDTTTLINGTYERNGQKEYTATYNHSKEPLVVKQGDVITYTLRIYNEGERDGYASQITDYIPEGLALIMGHNTNFNNGWKLSEDIDADKQIINLVGEKGFYKTEEEVKNLKLEDFEDITSLKEVQLATGRVTITSAMLEDELLKAFDKNKTQEEEGWQKATTGEGGLYYKDIEVTCLVVAKNTCKDVLTNVAEISEDKDDKKQDVEDRDSTPNNVITKDEDDNDYEPVVLKCFDLALRKFITGVETEGKTNNITSRIPNPKIGEDGKILYEHTKDPVEVAQNDTVIYTIRVYNEGTIAGYAEEITDDIPEGLEFIPEHNTNKEYQWVMIDKDGNITENVEEAVKVTTDYLSKAKGEDKNLIDAFDISKGISKEESLNPDYKDVKVAFKVEEPNTSDRIIINSAQISEDSGDDEDSIPDEWNEREDDQDQEKIYVKYFDLSLLKWVTKTIVTVDGTTTTTQTNFKPNTGKTETPGIRDNNEAEPIAKVVIDKKKLKKTTVKFAYKIRVTNEGEIPGYAAEITDFIPEGLEFKAEDNKAFGWVKEGDNKVTTRALETKLLNPGESAELEIIFTWKNDAKNLGVKTNVAEITEDYNENNAEDIDSVPDNKKDPYEKEQEDDDDFALVILSIKTGKGTSYVLFITAMLTLLASGMYLIKKYVLTY